jgi:formylglycine-generating enzyme required for sulfatase activity
MDFGLARAVEGSQGTHTGVVKGTMDYVAAERFSGASGPPADVYALGLVVWELLAGRRAAPQGELAAKIGWHLMTGPGDVRAARPDCPAWLAELLLAMTAREVATRPADGAAALGELRRLRAAWAGGGAAGRPPQAPPTVEVKVGGGGTGAAPGPRPAPPPTVQQRAVPRPGPPPAPPQVAGARRLVQGRAQGPFVFEMAYIPAGRFVMGSPPDEAGRDPDEVQHEVVLTRPFEIGVVPVTQGLYEAVMGINPSLFKGPMRPVESVSWFDAVALCNALSAALGMELTYQIVPAPVPAAGWLQRMFAPQPLPEVLWRPAAGGFRLPTEAEWEYAARAGGTYIYAGSHDIEAVGWTGRPFHGQSQPVGQKQANAWGLHDMSGHVLEWCWDWYGNYSGPSTDPVGAQSGPNRVIRGGSWFYDPRFARVAHRFRVEPGSRDYDLGLRLVRTIP